MIPPSLRPTLLVFDLDGTLLHAGGAGRRAMAGAFEAVCQAPSAIDGVDLRGMTDLAIFRGALQALGRAGEPGLVEALIEAYLRLLVEEVARAERFRVLPGVEQLLVTLSEVPSVAVGLGTGNLERGAQIKLERGRLLHHFTFGGFGSDHESRVEVLRLAARRGAERLGRELSGCRVVVIGDTPRDVSAGLAIGAEVVGVGTGGYQPQTLITLGASQAYADLAAPPVLSALIDGAKL